MWFGRFKSEARLLFKTRVNVDRLMNNWALTL